MLHIEPKFHHVPARNNLSTVRSGARRQSRNGSIMTS